jgi:hypothetical protein
MTLDARSESDSHALMPTRSSKRPADVNQLAKLIVDIATGEESESLIDPDTGKNAAAVALGRLGGKKGGAARAASLTSERRKDIATKAAKKRWEKGVDN